MCGAKSAWLSWNHGSQNSLSCVLPSSVQCSAVLSHFSRVQVFASLWTVVHKAPLSMGFCRQEYWSGLLCPPPGDLPNTGI